MTALLAAHSQVCHPCVHRGVGPPSNPVMCLLTSSVVARGPPVCICWTVRWHHRWLQAQLLRGLHHCCHPHGDLQEEAGLALLHPGHDKVQPHQQERIGILCSFLNALEVSQHWHTYTTASYSCWWGQQRVMPETCAQQLPLPF